jgi:hypothetical protein
MIKEDQAKLFVLAVVLLLEFALFCYIWHSWKNGGVVAFFGKGQTITRVSSPYRYWFSLLYLIAIALAMLIGLIVGFLRILR